MEGSGFGGWWLVVSGGLKGLDRPGWLVGRLVELVGRPALVWRMRRWIFWQNRTKGGARGCNNTSADSLSINRWGVLVLST